MYYFDNSNKNDPSSSHTSNDNNNNDNSNHPLFSQSFDPSTLHSLDNSYSFVNFDSDAPPSSFLQDGPSSSFGHDSLLAQDWEGMYGSAFGDSTQDHHGQMFLPLQQPQQQPQHQTQQSYSHSFEPDSQHKQQSAGNSDFFLSLTDQEQQAILMSEPNFLRQQHLLHDNEVKVKMEKQDDKQQLQNDNNDTGIPMRSNLSAMFDQSTPTDNHSDLASSVPAHSSNNLLQPHYQSTQHTMSNQQHQSQQQPTPATMTKPVPSSSKSRKEINRRSQQGGGGRSNHRTTPIPINGGSSSGSISKQSSSVPSEIDHQRRFNELQARFRVNYARKPTTSGNSTSASTSSQQNHQQQQPPPSSSSQQRQQQQIHASSPSTTKMLSSSFSGPSTNGFGSYGRADVNNGTAFGSSAPKPIDKTNVDSSAGGNTNNEKNTDRFSNHNSHHSSSTTISTTSTMGVAIPSGGNKNSSSSGGGKQASSFPSRTMPIQIQRVHRANANQPMDAEQHQKRLDDQLVKANFDDITVSELKEMLRQRGKPATGKKAILLQRLVEERDIIKAVRGGKITHRHSQPPPQSSSSSTAAVNHSNFENTNNPGLSPRPRSYQGSSPMFGHATLPPNSPLLDSPSSVPNSSMFLSSSPGSATLSLNRSIANMHIGSPPLSSQHVRRFSPYGTPGSPRLGSSSPKMQMQRQAYSSSVPSDYLSSSPGGGNGGSMALPPSFNNFGNDGYSNINNNTTATSPMSPGPPNSTRNMRLYHQNQTWNSRQKSYAPFTSSALATPDRDDEDDPFDVMAREQENVDMEGGQEQEEHQQHQEQQSQGPVQSQPLYDSLYQLQQHQQYDEQRQHYDQQDEQQQYQQQSGMDMEGVKEESMEWANNSSTGDQSLHGLLQNLPEGVSTEQFMAWIATMNAGTNEFDQFNLNMDGIKTENIDLSGMMAIDTNNTSYGDGSYDHQQQQHQYHHGGTDFTN
ncbi:hypothetical protein BCR42DRAFT_402774 [Absidia repens]|uniref:SAP domain-containing protein n=1 Tax=Absidia repens TaxID=90262 RepID=A0A1X2IYJ1_9FUNG|nr:hypothetical protein BCR42DRAFT_402774 [Absidia repens]